MSGCSIFLGGQMPAGEQTPNCRSVLLSVCVSVWLRRCVRLLADTRLKWNVKCSAISYA